MPTRSPAAWLKILETSLDRQARACKLYEDYYDGNHRLQFATAKFREAFGALLKAFADNWCELIVDASVERLEVQGFRFGDDLEADKAAWDIWQANNLDADSMMAHTEAVKCGAAYLLVEPAANGDDSPVIYTEHPSQMIVAHAPGNRRVRQAALKKWLDDDGFLMATLYLPDSVHKFRSQKKVSTGGRVDWRERESPAENPLGVTPVVPLYNNPTMKGGGRSDLLTVIPLQDAINKLICDLLVDSETIALPQRVLIGVEVPRDENGLPLPSAELKAIRSKLWAFASKDAKVEQLEGGDLSKAVQPIEMLLLHMAAISRTPPHYLLARMVNIAEGALKSAETGLVKKVERKKINFSDGWEDGMRLAFLAAGDKERAEQRRAETIWGDSETRSEGERTDALVKKRQSLDVPREVVWEEAGYTPTEIARMKAMEETDALLAAALGDSGGDEVAALPEPIAA